MLLAFIHLKITENSRGKMCKFFFAVISGIDI